MPTAEELLGGQRAAVIEGDCLAILPTLTGHVDHVITDPPYEAEAHTLQRRGRREGMFQNTALSFAAITAEQRDACGLEFDRLAARWRIVFCQIEAVHKWREVLPAYVRTMIWVKDTTTPQMTGDRPGMGYECIYLAHPPGKKSWNGGGRCGVFKGASVAQMGKANDHETQKPLSLMLELVELFTSPNDLILDPFSGSATTAIAALRLGRRALCIERDPKYAALSRDRIAAELSSSTLQAHRAGQLPLLR